MAKSPTPGVKFAKYLEEQESNTLQPYALKSRERRESLKTHFRESPVPTPLEYRTEYHRDRDRILWSKSFKRLQYKTQIFPHYAQDHYRRRLTHSLEVFQIATAVARSLGLNEIATEAIALGHDLGHPPFGHAGEVALSKSMKKAVRTIKASKLSLKYHEIPIPLFGFDHCVHAIETVSFIEKEYESETHTGGLNLTFDVRDGILKHMYDYDEVPKDRPLSKMSRVIKFKAFENYKCNKGSLEAQCVYFADKVAYLLGDIEDGLRSNILNSGKLNSHLFIECLRDRLEKKYSSYHKNGFFGLTEHADFTVFRSKALSVLILDCIDTSRKKIQSYNFSDIKDVLANTDRIVYVSKELSDAWDDFYTTWLRNYMFKHHDVTACTFKAEQIVSDLFGAYIQNQDLISNEYKDHSAKVYSSIGISDSGLLKLITTRNYVAGMTDAYATDQHVKLFMSSERAF